MIKYFFALATSSVLLFACGTTKKIKQSLYVEPTTGRIVQLQTEFGNMTIALNDSTPQHRDNFMKLVKEKFYDSLLFHRVIKEFMIQGGDPSSKNAPQGQMLGSGGLGYRVPAEFRPYLFHKKGVLAAARDNNPQMASSSCQFYIVQGKVLNDADLDNIERYRLGGKKLPDSVRNAYKTKGGTPHLDGTYTVFGEVIEGLEVLDKIAAQPTMPGDRPQKDIRMKVVVVR